MNGTMQEAKKVSERREREFQKKKEKKWALKTTLFLWKYKNLLEEEEGWDELYKILPQCCLNL